MAVIGDDWYYFPQSGIREMAKFLAGIYPDFSWERYEKLKQVFPLDEKMMLRRMSKGMQKQAAFWLMVCCMPEYLILDEPVDGLDPVMRRQVWSLLLGDVVISMETAVKQAKTYGHSLEREVGFLTVHSMLHLLGYDHLDEGPMKKQMRAAEEAILAEIELPR